MVKDLATHDIDLTAWVIQSPYATVSAQTAHKSGREHEDLISVTAQLAERHRRQPPRQLAVAR